MNIGKSLKLALVKRNMKQADLARKLGKSSRWINMLANSPTASSSSIEMLASEFGMKASEFVALGEE